MSICDNCDEVHDVSSDETDDEACIKAMRDQLQWLRGERDEYRDALRDIRDRLDGMHL